jgi:Rrf2 family protein
MKVSAKAEYACIAMLELAANHGEPHPVRVKAIADAHDIPQRFLVQILLQLKGAGLVESLRGAAGGYQLARSPDETSLGDIINAIDGPSPPRTTADGSARSPAVAAVRSVWHDLQTQEQRLLHDVSLADLVRRTYHNNALSYEI